MIEENHILILPDDIPSEVTDILGGDEEMYKTYRVEGCASDNGQVVVPIGVYDVSYLASLVDVSNAVAVRRIEIGGVECRFYERVDKSKTGYIVFVEPEAESIYYVEV